MVISSRTPEGMPNRCPVCGNRLRLEPSKPTLDAPCPHCGHLLWFAPSKPSADVRQSLTQAVLEIATARFGPLDPSVRARIEDIAEPERMRSLLDKAVRCSSLEELIVEPR